MSFYGQQRVQISISLKTYGRLCQDASMVWIHYREMQLSFMRSAQWMTEHHIGAHTTISGQRSTPTSRHCRSSRWTYWFSLTSWMDFRSSHYLHVKFIIVLGGFIHVFWKPSLRCQFSQINAYEINSQKMIIIFSLNTLGQWLFTIIK